jgi:exonuclease SbcD
MKILHTADWHIGKKLHKYDLLSDFELFIDWLVAFIEQEKIDVLLVAGDIFDLANPSNESKKIYYQSLVRLKNTGVEIIITGGNHDSPALLNAPKNVLKELQINVVGELPKNLKEVLIPIHNNQQKIEVVIAAIPYLRNTSLQGDEVAKTYDERVSNLRKGIQTYYQKIATIAEEKYPTIPCIAMGHLFAKGVSTSESERDIQLGNQASIEASEFGNYYSYIALGHIHKPQQVKGEIPIFYSGSPLPLSFSERVDTKRILVIDTAVSFEPISVEVPSFRKLISVSGSLSSVKEKLNALRSVSTLTDLIEIEIIENQYDPQISYQLTEFLDEFSSPKMEIVKHRIRFTEVTQKIGDVIENQLQLQEMKVQDVFDKRLEDMDLPNDKRELLKMAVDELLEEISTS